MNASAYNPGTTGGRREDLRNILTILEPEETPYTSRVRKGPAPKSTYVETIGDKLRKPKRTGTKEGTDGTQGGNKAKDRARFGVYIHRLQESFGVTDVQQVISERGGQAAIDDEYGNAKAKTIREMKRDMEAVNLGAQDTTGGTTDTDMVTRGAVEWIKATAQTTAAVPADYRALSGAIVSGKSFSGTRMTEDDLNGVLKTLKGVYGGKRTYFGLGGNNAVDTVDHFTRITDANASSRYKVVEYAEEHEITLMVSIFDSSFGRLEFQSSDFISTVTATGDPDPEMLLILNMELWHIDIFDDLHTTDLPDLGGGPNGQAKVMWANVCDSPRGNGKIYNS